MKGEVTVIIVAIAAVAGLLAYALSLGINGTLFSIGASIIGGLGGYKIKTVRDKRKSRPD